jgi:hypothetical protein
VESSKKPRRARNLEELSASTGRAFTEESYQAGLKFKPRPTDVLISPPGKSGTTWLQQIAHGLRTRGSMDFEEITSVTPWIEVAQGFGWDLEAEHVAEPRVFKSHMTWHDIPKGGRYIYSIRNPLDVLVSSYRFFEGWWFEVDSISIESFIRDHIKNYETRGYWHHISSWWEQRDNEDVLLLCYEEMKADLVGTVKKVAQFMKIDLDDELLDIVVHQSSKEFMLAHKSHFDDHLLQVYFESRGGAPPSPTASKVMPESNEEHYQVSPELRHDLDVIWGKMITQQYGFRDYSELRTAISELYV